MLNALKFKYWSFVAAVFSAALWGISGALGIVPSVHPSVPAFVNLFAALMMSVAMFFQARQWAAEESQKAA